MTYKKAPRSLGGYPCRKQELPEILGEIHVDKKRLREIVGEIYVAKKEGPRSFGGNIWKIKVCAPPKGTKNEKANSSRKQSSKFQGPAASTGGIGATEKRVKGHAQKGPERKGLA